MALKKTKPINVYNITSDGAHVYVHSQYATNWFVGKKNEKKKINSDKLNKRF